MGDYCCIYCEDHDDQCIRCSSFFYPDRIHKKCGHKWRDHETRTQEFYMPWSECPKEQV